MQEGIVFNIQKFCINDGPGIRTTVFLKGCPLHCAWCHNPESQKTEPEIMYAAEKCILCGACVKACPQGCHVIEGEKHVFHRDLCIGCGKCAEACMPEALECMGEKMTTESVLEEVMKDKAFYDTSGGGMTLSGGEPMQQFAFSLELLKLAKEKGLHTCMETCGAARKEDMLTVAQYVDIFLYDYKLWDAEKHKEYTGVTNEKLLENLFALDESGAKSILRCPIIPTVNDTPAHFSAIAQTAERLKNVLEIHIEPYHPLGVGKAERLARDYSLGHLSMPEEETVQSWIKAIASETKVPVRKA